MNQVKERGQGTGAQGWTLTATAAAVVVLMAAGTPAVAQQTPATADSSNTVVVTGIRRGIESAISVKKNSDSIVEAVSAEDIGKLPDNSIAESIARLPGLAAQRVAGRAQEIQIRGLAGQFAGTTLNGREQVSTGDNRAVEFDQYPSELLSAVVVYKTPDAALVGQGLSGTVDLQTVRPLSFAKRTLAANVRAERNSLGALNAGGEGADGHRLFVSYIDQFADRTFGMALGYARLQSPNQNQYYRNWGYPTGSGMGADGGQYNDVRLPGGVQVRAESAKQTRDALMGVFEWKPSKAYSSVLDLYYSKFERVALQRGFEAGLAWSGAQINNAVVSGATPVAGQPNTFSGGVLTGADYVGVKPVLRHDLNEREDTIKAIGWNNTLKMGAWTGVADISYSKADRKESIMEQYAGTVPGSAGATDTFGVILPEGGGLPRIRAGLNYADPNIIRLVDSGGWGQDGYIKFPHVTDELKSVRLTGKRDLEGLFSRVEAGFNYTEREKSRTVPEGFLRLIASPTTVPAGMLRSPTSMGFMGMGGILSWDPKAALSLYNFETKEHRDIVNKNWTVNEKISTGYAKLDLDTELFSIPVRGNFGAQIIHSNQTSTAFDVPNANQPTVRTLRSEGATYTDVLPSLNLAFSLPSDQTVRLGIARQIARPRMDEMRAVRFTDVNVTRCPAGTTTPETCAFWEGNGGNPQLKPWTANAFDLSYEKYFGTKAYVGLAGFYKDLRTYIYTQKIERSFAGATAPVGKPTPTNPVGLYETPANGKGGSMQGVEFSLSLPGNLFTPMLDGFGTVVSFSLTDSKIQPFGPDDTRPLPGLSRKVGNVTVYYEKHGFSSRVSYRDRSKFVGEITGFGADREFTYVKPERIIDLQLGYEFQGGIAKGLSLLFQVNNATNAAYSTYYNNDPTQVREYTKYGRTYLLGASFKL